MTGALERCVGDVGRFAEEHWGRKPLYRPGADPEGFAGLLDLGDVDHLVTETLLWMPSFRVVKEGKPLDPKTYTQTIRIGSRPVDRTIRPDRVLAAFEDGATIVLQALHRQWTPVARFCRELELALTHPVQANAYVTPPNSRGFSVHHDTHDVFVLQTHGHKRWRVYEPGGELPGKEQPWSRSRTDPGDPVLEAELAPGDCLYLPRGFPHDAVAREEVSIHVTVGIPASTWVDVWRHVLAALPEHAPFRETLAIGYANDPAALAEELSLRVKELQAFVEEQAGEEAAAAFAERFWGTRRLRLQGGGLGLRVLLIKRRDRPERGPRRCFAAFAGRRDRALRSFEIDDPHELLDLDLPALVRSRFRGLGAPLEGPLFLVCTPGQD